MPTIPPSGLTSGNSYELRWTLSKDKFKAFLYEVVVVDQDFRNPLATHCRHRYAVHKTIALDIALFIQAQSRQKRFTRLRMNRYAAIVQDLTDRTSGCLPQMGATLSQAVQKLGQHLISRN